MAQKGAANSSRVTGTTARAAGFAAKAGKERGDTGLSSAKQGAVPSVQKHQAKQNNGPTLDFHTSLQKVTPTKLPAKQAAVNANRTKAFQNTMTGSGGKKG
jgi:hypothetical protein